MEHEVISPRPLFAPGARPSRLVIGVVHLLPLPGAPRWGGDFGAVLDRARADLLALAGVPHRVPGPEGTPRGTWPGVDAVIVEYFGDAPFRAGSVEPVSVASM